MKPYQFLSYSFIAGLFLFLGCDGIITNGKVRLNNSQVAVLNEAIPDKDYGYAELAFDLEADTDTSRSIGLLIKTHDATNINSCEITSTGTGTTAALININSATASTLPIADLTVGAHTLGCELVKIADVDTVKLYLDGALISTYLIPTLTPILNATGRFGFKGYSSSNEVGIRTYSFGDTKPL